ncbi:MAG: MFS transporter [Nitrososphaerota archaeon]|nr:MFS transporter [Nitrososphaerota archaeon]
MRFSCLIFGLGDEPDFGCIAVPTPDRFSNRYKVIVLVSVTVARIIYSVNWFTLSPGLYQVANDFHATLPSLGILESTFLIGAGIFQVPASYAAARWNAKLLTLAGLGLIAFSNGLGSIVPNFTLLIVARFLLGIGVAMFFSPAIIIVAPMFRNESQGIALGLYNSAFSIGGVIGLFGWGYFVQVYNWRVGLLLGAVLAAFALFELQLTVKHGSHEGTTWVDPRRALSVVLKDRQIWMMGLGMLGVWSAYYAVTQFMPFYETNVHSISPGLAGFMASIISITPIPGALFGGWLSDRLRNRKAFMLYPSIVFGAAVMLIGYANFAETLTLLVILGLMNSFAFTAMYAAPFQMAHLNVDQKAISISLMNGVQIAGAFILPIIFTLAASSMGYEVAWLSAGLFVVVFVPLLGLILEPFKLPEYRQDIAEKQSDSK